jgi:hypothetical protein
MDELAICIVLADGKYYLLLDDKNKGIAGFKSVRSAVRQQEGIYNERHARSYEASMSACIGAISFQLSFLKSPGIPAIRQALFGGESADGISAVSVRNNSGGFTGALLSDEIGQQWWESGEKPRLISI